MFPRYKAIDLSKVKTISIKNRKSKVHLRDFAKPFDPRKGDFSLFLNSLPSILVANDLREFVEKIIVSRKKKKPVILLFGAHVIKVGLSPLIIDLLKRGVITSVAMNSAAAIHDVESSLWGKTSEDVAENLSDGSFGMSKETGDFVNRTLASGMRQAGVGYGEALGHELVKLKAEFQKISVLATCYKLHVPATVHAAIGTDIVHQQPTMNGAATGEMSFRDFKILCKEVSGLVGGGVVMNWGSAVIMPEVFLKALTVARNLGFRAKGFVTANFDMIQHYRPLMNVVSRPTLEGGRGFQFTGHHEIMIPLLCAMIKQRLG
jgi:hypothetical protein